MKVREAARIARVGSSTITSWRAGAHPMDLLAVRRLAEALGVSFSFLLTGEADRREPSTSVAALFEEREVFAGYARVTIHELVPRRPQAGGVTESPQGAATEEC
jgi:transcriptional regulator with XRE-family HTH domain